MHFGKGCVPTDAHQFVEHYEGEEGDGEHYEEEAGVD